VYFFLLVLSVLPPSGNSIAVNDDDGDDDDDDDDNNLFRMFYIQRYDDLSSSKNVAILILCKIDFDGHFYFFI
jgi:hypothetical protein